MLAYERHTGEKMTYRILADLTGLAEGTLHNIGSHRKSSATLDTLAQICAALDITPGDLLELIKELPKAKRSVKKKKKK